MTTTIKDGSSGSTAKVDKSNRLATFATTQEEETTEALDGNTYTATTGRVSLTTANESALIYIKNDDDAPWIMSRLFMNVGNSNATTGDWTLKVKKGVTTGTLISAGTVVIPQNLNFGSGKELSATILKGVDSSTATDGVDVIDSLIPSDNTRVLITNNPFVIEQGSTVVITVTPAASNTSWVVQGGFVVSRFTGEL